MPERASLNSPRGKLERARQHLKALDAETARFFESNPYEIGSEFRPSTSQYVFWIEPTREPPDTLGLLLGDYAHNLRCALDHLICQLARLNGPSDCDTTQFPISGSAEAFERVEPTWLAGISAEHRAMIKRMQPYHAGDRQENHALNILRWLDNLDKHRVVHPAFGYFDHPGPTPPVAFNPNEDAGRVLRRAMAAGRRIEGKTEFIWLTLEPTGPNPLVEMYGQFSFTPAFGGRWLKGTKLAQIGEAVSRTVEAFAPAFE